MKRFLNRSGVLIIFLAAAAFAAAVFPQDGKLLVLQVQWVPQAQFAGYIMAMEKGIFTAEGLDVDVRFSDENSSPITELRSGRADFCTAWLSTTLTLDRPVVNICQVLQKSTLMLVARKESGIRRPEEMNGKKVAIWGGDFAIQPLAFFRKYGIKPVIVPQSYNIDAFLVGACDVASAMYYNEYNKIYLSGVDQEDLVPFFYSDYGLNFPEDGVYCTRETWENHPKMCRSMRRAVLNGWAYAFAHPEETLDVLMDYCAGYRVRTNRAQQKWMLEAIRQAVVFGVGENPSGWGVLKKDDYQRVSGELLRQGFVKTVPAYEEFYKD
ncbi:MAG: ABC transporter substrate-binding protein [Candidatus Aminicenantes bacterium]|nr:ABC transporter substrate-binding protein [Candidatus Aminicenantes bacterium]